MSFLTDIKKQKIRNILFNSFLILTIPLLFVYALISIAFIAIVLVLFKIALWIIKKIEKLNNYDIKQKKAAKKIVAKNRNR
jgi:hypothetical protein